MGGNIVLKSQEQVLDLRDHIQEVIFDGLLVEAHFDFVFHSNDVDLFFELIELTHNSGLDVLSVNVLYFGKEKGEFFSLFTVKHTERVNLGLKKDILEVVKGDFGQDKLIVKIFLNQRVLFLGLLEVFFDHFLVQGQLLTDD